MPVTSGEVWSRIGLGDPVAVTDIAGEAAWGGLPVGNATALATGIGAALGPSLGRSFAPAPLGVVTFDNATSTATDLYLTYSSVGKSIWVRGLDLATDVSATDRVTVDLSYSWQSQNIFRSIPGGNNLPLMSNSPNSRGSLGVRYRNDENGLGFEFRTRYNEAYPVNSTYYPKNSAFPIAAGQTGATANATGGANRCSPAPTGTFCYENVPEALTVDAQVSKRFDLGSQKLTWSLNAQNMFDNRMRTCPGVPETGRLIMTRLQYSF